jgi:rod shape-determining protein MreD
MRRAAFSALVLLAAVVLQITLVASLPLPGAAGPDLVLVAVAALAVTGGPLEGVLAGFCSGLALDVAPPALHLVGQDALVFSLAGYAVGRVAAVLEGTAWPRLAAVAAGAVGGEALQAGVGILFSEPGVTWSAARQVLPAAAIYDCLLSPFVLAAVAGLRDRAGAPGSAPSSLGGELAALTAAAAAPLAGLAGATWAVRSTGTGRTPRLRGAGRPAPGWLGSRPPPGQGHQPAHPAPRLRLRGGRAGSSAAVPVRRTLPARPVKLRLGSGRRGDRLPGAAVAVGALGDARTFLGGAHPRAGSFRGGPTALRRAGQGGGPGARLRAGSFRGGLTAARPAPSGLPRARPGKGAFRGGPTAARAAAFLRRAEPRGAAFRRSPSAARPASLLPRVRPRRGAFRGGPTAARPAPGLLRGRVTRLRIGSRRRRDGVLGGSVSSMLGGTGRRGRIRLSPGRAAAPRFRPRGLGSRRAGRGLTGLLAGSRLAGGGLRLGRPRRRSRVWLTGNKRTGGL